MARVIAIDYGERRIGVAAGDTDIGIATPLETLESGGADHDARAILALCRADGADTVVLGLPVNMDGSAGAAARRVEDLAAKLRMGGGPRVETFDERLTTRLVERALLEADLSRGKRRKARDKLAAQVILQGYLDARLAAGRGK